MNQERWLGDHRSTGYVEWPDGLREELREERHGLRRSMLLWPALTFPALVVGICFSFLGSANGWHGTANALTWAAVGVGIVVFAFGLMRCVKAVSRRRAIARVLRSEQLERFTLDQGVIDELLLACDQREDLRNIDPLAGIPMDLLLAPRSDLLVCAGDFPDRPLQPALVRTVSTHSTLDQSSDGHTIQLTPLELKELKQYRTKQLMIVPTLLVLVAILIGGAAWSVQTLNSGVPLTFRDWKLFIGTGFLFLVAVYSGFFEVPKRLRLARAIRQDIEAGYCEIVDGESAVDDLIASGLPERHRPTVTPVIVRRLPHSKLWWLLDDTPAGWRRYEE